MDKHDLLKSNMLIQTSYVERMATAQDYLALVLGDPVVEASRALLRTMLTTKAPALVFAGQNYTENLSI